ncbi:MAG: hemin uptake protein HemP [Pseudoruegeria sp.]
MDDIDIGDGQMKIDHPNSFTPDPQQQMTPTAIPRHDVAKLVGDGNLAHIQLNDQIYTLRITRHGKLILTK